MNSLISTKKMRFKFKVHLLYHPYILVGWVTCNYKHGMFEAWNAWNLLHHPISRHKGNVECIIFWPFYQTNLPTIRQCVHVSNLQLLSYLTWYHVLCNIYIFCGATITIFQRTKFSSKLVEHSSNPLHGDL